MLGYGTRVRVLGYADRRRSALAVISWGIAGLTEMRFWVEPGHRGIGGGTELVGDVLGMPRRWLRWVPCGMRAVWIGGRGRLPRRRSGRLLGSEQRAALETQRRHVRSNSKLKGRQLWAPPRTIKGLTTVLRPIPHLS